MKTFDILLAFLLYLSCSSAPTTKHSVKFTPSLSSIPEGEEGKLADKRSQVEKDYQGLDDTSHSTTTIVKLDAKERFDDNVGKSTFRRIPGLHIQNRSGMALLRPSSLKKSASPKDPRPIYKETRVDGKRNDFRDLPSLQPYAIIVASNIPKKEVRTREDERVQLPSSDFRPKIPERKKSAEKIELPEDLDDKSSY
jgi:hypothetical protein